ncbi:MAG: FtsL-like putative cell division protein [Flavobacteriales bacterium]|nr:FtsL-like putative cell division protein [Flavobacteriales bacterium]MCX7768363.1 FtsL-like putative cell division protein [Flavobacteriales bacterium]MDW8409077.1 FtsL-like putative cell division protein [Flavobacteriales bacterium]
MMKVQEIKTPPRRQEATTPAKGRPSMVSRAGQLLRGDFLATAILRRELPYLVLLAVLGTLYIGNAYRAEKKMMEIRKLQARAKDLHTRYIALKSELLFTLTRSEVENALKDLGIKQITQPPRVILYDPNKIRQPIY